MKALVQLKPDRSLEGTITFFEIPKSTNTKQVRCLAKSDNTKAKNSGNESRDPLKPFGDLPTGTYKAVITTAESNDKYGPHKRWVLNALTGDAWTAVHDNGRYSLMIHGGKLRNGKLRPTYGCLRLDDETMEWLAGLGVTSFEIEVRVAA